MTPETPYASPQKCRLIKVLDATLNERDAGKPTVPLSTRKNLTDDKRRRQHPTSKSSLKTHKNYHEQFWATVAVSLDLQRLHFQQQPAKLTPLL